MFPLSFIADSELFAWLDVFSYLLKWLMVLGASLRVHIFAYVCTHFMHIDVCTFFILCAPLLHFSPRSFPTLTHASLPHVPGCLMYDVAAGFFQKRDSIFCVENAGFHNSGRCTSEGGGK